MFLAVIFPISLCSCSKPYRYGGRHGEIIDYLVNRFIDSAKLDVQGRLRDIALNSAWNWSMCLALGQIVTIRWVSISMTTVVLGQRGCVSRIGRGAGEAVWISQTNNITAVLRGL